MSRTPTPAEVQDADDLLPGPDWTHGHVEEGGDDHLVLIPGDPNPAVVIRFARRPEVGAELPRRMRLLTSLAPHLPYALPEPLTEVVTGERTGAAAVGQTYLPGAPHPPHEGDPEKLRPLLEHLASVPDYAWMPHLEPAYTVQPRWDPARRRATLEVLPAEHRSKAEAVWVALDAIDGEENALVHGDLAGDNMRWQDGNLTGLLDWDHAARWDPAINLAHLTLWHGPDVMSAAPDARFAARAGVWVGHLALIRVHDAAARQAAGGTVRRWSRLLRKTLPRLDLATQSVAQL
jgi:hypothetical protein